MAGLYFKGTTTIKNYHRRTMHHFFSKAALSGIPGDNLREMATLATDRQIDWLANSVGWHCEAIDKVHWRWQAAWYFWYMDYEEKRDRRKDEYKALYDCGAISYLEYERRCTRIDAAFERLTDSDYTSVRREWLPKLRAAILAAIVDKKQ